MQQCGYQLGLINHAQRNWGAHVDEAVVEVEADEAGRDARVGDARVLDDAPDDVVGAGARRVVERGAQRRPGAGATRKVAVCRGEQESAVRR